MDMRENFGKEVTDSVTGFTGVIIGHCVYMTGCEQVLLAPKVTESGDFRDSHWFDIDRVFIDTSKRTNGSDRPAPKK